MKEPVPEKTSKRNEKIKEWLKNPYNLALLGVLLFSFVVLCYYFSMTKSQTLWWDEAEYMSTAKHWAFNVPYDINPQRPPLIPFLAFIFYSLGFGDLAIKFLIELLPAFLSVFFFYVLVKEMYNPKIALISSFILSVSWIHLFYSMRFMTDSMGFLFGILAFLCFWKGYVNKQGNHYLWLVGFFIALSFLCRLTGVLYGAVIVLFLLLSGQFEFLKNKHMWAILLIFILTISPYLIWSYIYFGNPLAFRSGYNSPGSTTPLGWWMLQLLYDYPEKGFFIFFLIGIVAIFPMILSFDLIFKKKDKTYYNDLFMLISVIFTLFFFIFFLRQGENRWPILMSIGIFVIAAKGITLVYDVVQKNLGKSSALFILVLMLASGAYFQLSHADDIIRLKLDSYQQVKEAALWMKENSGPSDIIATASVTQTTFYAEREIITFLNATSQAYTPEQFLELVKLKHPKYLAISVFEPWVPQWSYTFTQGKENLFIPVQAWFSDTARTQPILIIYEYNRSK